MSATDRKLITPQQAQEGSVASIPQAVYDAFNELIIANFNRNTNKAKILQSNVVAVIAGKTELSAQDIFDRKWLDVEQHYRDIGWKVSYDRPGYNESYEPTFEFSV